MGRKRLQSQTKATESFGQMVSKAALTQLMGPIRSIVEQYIRNLGSRLAIQQARTISDIYIRIVALEKILIENKLTTEQDVLNKVIQVEDESEGLTPADEVQEGDTVRLEARAKVEGQDTYSAERTRLKVANMGKGDNLGTEVEKAILGMKVGDIREVESDDKGSKVEITVNRIGRPAKQEAKTEVSNGDQVQEQ
jgi:hypothetical protein